MNADLFLTLILGAIYVIIGLTYAYAGATVVMGPDHAEARAFVIPGWVVMLGTVLSLVMAYAFHAGDLPLTAAVIMGGTLMWATSNIALYYMVATYVSE
jgi:4-hydroxybenzoate polyprenyltransferase